MVSMFRSMTVINDRNESLTISLADPRESGYLISGIDGLGPRKPLCGIPNRSLPMVPSLMEQERNRVTSPSRLPIYGMPITASRSCVIGSTDIFRRNEP